MLHYCNVCPIRCTHHTCLDVPVDSLEPGSVNDFHLFHLKCPVYSPPFQVATKWTHLILFPCFSLNLFSCIIKSSIFLRDKGGPCSLFQERLWLLQQHLNMFLLFFPPFVVCAFSFNKNNAVTRSLAQHPSPLISPALDRFACDI